MATGAGLATAFYRLFILYALERAPARPAAILASLHACARALPLEGGTFTRAVQQLLDAGLVITAQDAALELTVLGRRERESQRVVWEPLIGLVGRLLAGELPPPEPPTGGGVRAVSRSREPVPDAYRERVVLAEIREGARRARDADEAFGIALAEISVVHPQPLRGRAMLQRCLRETIGRARSTFGSGVVALRYGPSGVCLVVQGEGVEAQAELLRARLHESLAAMTATVSGFAAAGYAVRVAPVRWSRELLTSGRMLDLAEAALAAGDGSSQAA